MVSYKYLGYHMHEHLKHQKTVEILTSSAKRAFGKIINMFKKLGNMGYKTYTTLYNSNILSIANYASGVWGFQEFKECRVLQNKVIRFFLGTHVFTPLAALYCEMGWMDIRHTRWTEVLRLNNRIDTMPVSRWPKRIWQYDRATNIGAGLKDVMFILDYAGMYDVQSLEGQVDIDLVSKKLNDASKSLWEVEVYSKRKLRTFIHIHDFENITLATSNLTRRRRSLLIKLKSGVLSIRFKTGWYKGLKEERLCEICNKGKIEDEIHFLYKCKPLKYIRRQFLNSNKIDWSQTNRKDKLVLTKFLLNKENIKHTAVWLEEMYDHRKEILYT